MGLEEIDFQCHFGRLDRLTICMSHCVSRIAGELALIGFVFPRPVGTVFSVKLCCEENCVEFGVERIGFVLHKSGLIVEGG